MWARSSKLALSRRTLHYPKVIWTLSQGRTKCGHGHPGQHYLGVPFTIRRWFGQELESMWARSSKLALSRRTLHYPKVIWTTVRKMWTRSSKLALSRLTFHCQKKGFGPTVAKLTVCEVELVQCWSNVGLIGIELGPKSNKVGIIDNGFGTQFHKVDTIGHPN